MLPLEQYVFEVRKLDSFVGQNPPYVIKMGGTSITFLNENIISTKLDMHWVGDVSKLKKNVAESHSIQVWIFVHIDHAYLPTVWGELCPIQR